MALWVGHSNQLRSSLLHPSDESVKRSVRADSRRPELHCLLHRGCAIGQPRVAAQSTNYQPVAVEHKRLIPFGGECAIVHLAQ